MADRTSLTDLPANLGGKKAAELPFNELRYDGLSGELPRLSGHPLDALPILRDPEAQPLVTEDIGEDLVRPISPRLALLDTYAASGFWDEAADGTMLRRSAALRLAHAAESLPIGFGLALFDGYRPPPLQQELYTRAYADTTLPAGFVWPPSTDPRTPPPHTTGGTADVTLTFKGTPLALGTTFDDFTAKAGTAHYEDDGNINSDADLNVRDLRRLLFWAMRRAGFVAYPPEWWHFEYGTRRWAAVRRSRPMYGFAHLHAESAAKHAA